MKPSSEMVAASAGRSPWFTIQRVGGQSTVATTMAIATGSRITQNLAMR